MLVAALVLALAAALFLSVFGTSNGQKIGPNTRIVEAPVAPPVAPVVPVVPPVPAEKAPQTGKVTITPQGGIVVDGVNPDRTGVNQNVTVQLPACGSNCPPRVIAPQPCQTCAPRPVVKPYVRPAPRVYRPAPQVAPPAPRPAASCFVQVDVQGPPSEIQIKDGQGRIVGRANVVGSGRVPVPCEFARAGAGQICLITGGANAPARDLNPEWFSMAQRNLASGNTLLNAGHPVWFRKG